MRFRISPDAGCQLDRDGRSVRLEGDELAGLSSLLRGAGAAEGHERELLGRLFSLGLVEPETGDMRTTGVARRRAQLGSSCLSPWLRFQVRFVSGDTGIPSGEAAAGLFLEPAVVAAASDLSNRLGKALRSLTSAAAVRGEAMSPELVQPLVEQMAGEWWAALEPDVPIGRTADAERIRFDVPDALSSTAGPAVAAWSAELTVIGRRERRSVRVPLTELGTVARVLEAVARATVPELDLSSPTISAVLEAVDGAAGWMANADAPKPYPSPAIGPDELATTHMGHACLILDSETTRVLVDPWLFPWHADNRRQPLGPGQLGAVDAICFTHYHADHLDLASLLTLPHDVPVFVPEEEDKPFAPRISKLLGLFGFSDVRPLAPGQTATVGDLMVEAVPFFGEGRNHLGFAATCFCVSLGDVSVLAHADASPDSSGASLTGTDAFKDLVDRRGAVDVVFGSWWQERTFRCQLSSFAPLLPQIPPADWLVGNEHCDCSAEYLEELVTGSRAKLFVTYAESGPELFLPEDKRSAYVPTISLLWRSWDDIAQRLRTVTGAAVVAAEPYQVIATRPGRPPEVREPDFA